MYPGRKCSLLLSERTSCHQSQLLTFSSSVSQLYFRLNVTCSVSSTLSPGSHEHLLFYLTSVRPGCTCPKQSKASPWCCGSQQADSWPASPCAPLSGCALALTQPTGDSELRKDQVAGREVSLGKGAATFSEAWEQPRGPFVSVGGPFQNPSKTQERSTWIEHLFISEKTIGLAGSQEAGIFSHHGLGWLTDFHLPGMVPF